MKKFMVLAVCLGGIGLLGACPAAKTGITFKYTPLDATQNPEMKVAVNIVSDEQQYDMTRGGNGSFETTIDVKGTACEFFFFISDPTSGEMEAIGDMRDYDGQFEPSADYYVDDAFGGFDALYLLKKDQGVRKVIFTYKPVDDDWFSCEDDNMYIDLWIDDQYYEMDYNESKEQFEKTVEVRGNNFEFYFSVCDNPITDMRAREGNFLPAVKYYSADSFGGYNALYID